LHHAAQKVALVRNEQSLISDEKAISRQADPKKAFGSTFNERKQMSTKTSIKRIALIAVSALGFGLMSVVPAKAAQVFVTTAITATVAAAEVSTASGVASISVVAGTPALADETAIATVKAALTSRPATAAGAIYNDQTADAGDCDYGADVAAANAGGIMTMTLTGLQGGNGCAAQSTTFGSFKYVVTVAGSYTMTIWNDQDANGVVSLGEESVTASFTGVAPNTTPSATYSTIEAWSVATPSQTKAAGTDLDGNDEIINITVENTADAALNGTTVRAVVNGPGTVTLTPGGGGAAATGRDVSVTNAAGNNIATLELLADGTAGYTTVDIYSGTVKLGSTAKVLWYGSLATLKVVQSKSVVTKNTALTDAVTISGLDEAGNPVPLADDTVVGTSSDTTVLATKANGNDAVADGVLTVSVTGANDTTTTSGRSATMTWKYLISGTTYTPDVVTTFSIGGAVAAITITLDKATYAPGEKVTATIVATDASKNPAGDSTVFGDNNANTATFTSNVSVQGITNSDIATVGGKATTTFYAPAASGTFSISGSATIGGVATTITSSSANVVSAGETAAEAATDAALEAIDAANAAVDAANQATEAADAATVAAEEARDAADAATAAVEALAADVAKMINEIKAQLNAMAKTIATIAKRVK
jgi:hypothetical protein